MSKISQLPVVPQEYCGMWIAWDFDETQILAAGESYAETKAAAQQKGELRPVLVKAPLAESRSIGGSR